MGRCAFILRQLPLITTHQTSCSLYQCMEYNIPLKPIKYVLTFDPYNLVEHA